MVTEDEAKAIRKRYDSASSDPAVPKLYVNSFVNTTSAADITTVFEWNGRPVCMLTMSYTTAKTFAAALGQTIGNLETAVGKDMLTNHEVEEKLKLGRKPDEFLIRD